MRIIKHLVVVYLLLVTTASLKADEGMWLLSLLEGHTIEEMQSKGFQLSAEDIYSINEACLKDAVVIFGGGCTGEMISGDGLVLTNHHCGYGAIQSHSSVENDYLTDGFWAMSREEELPNQELSVRFLRYMEDVGQKVFEGVEDASGKRERDLLIKSNISGIIDEAEQAGRYEATVRPMFYGNQYFLFVYERYSDVRLVGAPPGSIGNFGEDNDNWMWPRHTGDFSIFRVYADQNNEPAAFSTDNVPYTPGKFLEISMDGVNEGDFTMILGYPGSTRQFLYSMALKNMTEISLPLKIELRTRRMEVMDRYMKDSDTVRIQYASKYRRVSNAWKKWQGAIRGLKRLDAVNRKLEFEQDFREWMNESGERKLKYGEVLDQFESIYSEMEDYLVIYDLMTEAVKPLEIFRIASVAEHMMKDTLPPEDIRERVSSLYKDYHPPIVKDMFAAMLKSYREYADSTYYPEFFTRVDKKFDGDFKSFADKTFSKTFFQLEASVDDLIELYDKNPGKALRKLEKDPVLQYLDQLNEIYLTQIRDQMGTFYKSLNELYRIWVQGHFEFQPEVRHYPDANFTMRLTYGEVDGYSPADAIDYDYFTTLAGVIEKNREGKLDYAIPEKLEDLFNSKNYGEYGMNGTMPVCFTASNHTSGGNSGSPVIDANGRLIGINFDRNWHGTMSDEMYDPEMCRNIAVDIRYILFIIDKFAGAGYLIDEMVLISE
ncbi:MAG: S46 family peptidase [Bacteroidales bacterium]|nr:S46 family peptidase [Bacteroidales bacterium]